MTQRSVVSLCHNLIALLSVSGPSLAMGSTIGVAIAMDKNGEGRGGPIGDVRLFDSQDNCERWSEVSAKIMPTIAGPGAQDANWQFTCKDVRSPDESDEYVSLGVLRGVWIASKQSDALIVDYECYRYEEQCRAAQPTDSTYLAMKSVELGVGVRIFYRERGFEIAHGFRSCYRLDRE